MAVKVRIAVLMLFLVAALPVNAASSGSSDTNFSLSPAPIPYPYFQPGWTEGKLDASYLNLKVGDYVFNGLGVYGKGRMALNDFLAFDLLFGGLFMGGQMAGVGPITLLPAYTSGGSFVNYYGTRVDGKSQVTVWNMTFAGNVEIQAVHTQHFSIIVFLGPNMNMMSMSMKTPFSLIVPTGFANAGQVYSGYSDTLTTSMFLTGFQGGVQIDIPLGEVLRFAPFVIFTSTGGSGTIKDNPGSFKGANNYYAGFSVPSTTSMSAGFDIFINDISLGAMAQSSKSQDATTGTSTSTMYLQLTVGFRFGNHEKPKEGETTGDVKDPAAPAAK